MDSKSFVSVEINDVLLKDVQTKLGTFYKSAPKLLSRALNEAMRGAKTQVGKEIRANYTIETKRVNETLSQKASKPNELYAEVRSIGSRNPLSYFKVTPKTINGKRKSSLKASVNKKTPAEEIPGVFWAKLRKTGEPDLYKRKGDKRFPVEKKYSISTPEMLENTEIKDPILERANQRFHDRVNHHIYRELSKRGAT